MRATPAYMIGKLVYDYALGKSGIVVSGAWTEERPYTYDLHWEWLVLYEDGELMGGDTNDLQEVA